ncbi:hypothetical protein [Nonomuraea guangzhouensis]|uniref:hypothetical protein n=1 Tax=Nonomuraea guangzhouensis TaxID=1291555 RepID=UPI001C5FAF7D|nr:hypothetical protein [Nonomuraea guangzhouensis]
MARIRARAAGYAPTSALTDFALMDEYVVSPSLGDHSGIAGTIELGMHCLALVRPRGLADSITSHD